MVLIAVSVADVACANDVLSEARLQKAAALTHESDRLRSLCAGLALDACLRTVGLRERDVCIQTNEHGKPFLVDYRAYHFSLSHSGDFAVCALDDAPIGVDIEQHRPIDTARFASRVFRNQPSLTREAFFDLWTKKESYVKAVGIGLSGLHTEIGEGWYFRTYPLDGYSLTVCSRKTTFTPLSFYDGTVLPR